MAKRPTSRFESIFREELKSGKGIISSLGTAGSESRKEKRDVRNLLPKTGILGAILENKFGKSYRYSGPKGPSIESKSASVQAASSRIMAKNSMFLPIIAKDMNVMRQNIQMLVKKQGITPKTRENYSKPQVDNPASSKPSAGPSKTGFFGGLMDSVGSLGSGILGIGESILSGLTGIIGGVGGGFLKIFSSMTGFGLTGLIALVAGGWAIYSLAKSIDFTKIGSDLGKMFDGTFNEISKSLKEFFGIKEDETFLEGFARKLDETFNTSFFTTSLNKASKALEESSNLITNNFKSSFNTIMAHGLAAAKTLGDVMIAVGKDIIGYTRRWMDQQQDTIYMLIGAAIGGVIGSSLGVGAVVGAAIGAISGKKYGQWNQAEDQKLAAHYESTFGGKEGAAKQLEAQIKMGSQMIDANLDKSDDAALMMKDEKSRKWLASYLSLRQGGKPTPEEMEKDIIYDLQYHGGNKYKGWTVAKVKEEVSSYERALRKINPERGINNLANFDWKSTYEKNVQEYLPESNSGSGASGFPLKDKQSETSGKGLVFAKFPTAEAGFKAQRDLWERKYSNMTIATALKSWAPDATENYGKALEKVIGKSISSTKFADLTEQEKVAFLNEQARQEGFFKPGSKPNRLNNPGALLFAETQRQFGGEPVQPSPQQLASNSKNAPSQENTTAKNQPELSKYEKMSDVELLLAAFGTMFGDLATSILELADSGNKQAGANKDVGKVSSASALNYELIASEVGLLRVLKGGETG